MNEIVIRGLEVEAHLGVPDAERAERQRIVIHAVITPLTAFSDLADRIERTVDYAAAAREISALAAARPRRLIETLAFEIAEMVVNDFPAARAEIEVRKFILPDTAYVAVRCVRERRPVTTFPESLLRVRPPTGKSPAA